MRDPASVQAWCKEHPSNTAVVSRKWGSACVHTYMARETDGYMLRVNAKAHDRLRDKRTTYVSTYIQGRGTFITNVSGDAPYELFTERSADYRRIPVGTWVLIRMVLSGTGGKTYVDMASFKTKAGGFNPFPGMYVWCNDHHAEDHYVSRSWGEACVRYNVSKQRDGHVLYVDAVAHDRIHNRRTVYVSVSIRGRPTAVANVSGEHPQEQFTFRVVDYRKIPKGTPVVIRMVQSGGGGTAVMASFRT